MCKNQQTDTVHGYEIKRSIVFENDRGFALGENPEAVEPFVTWQFTEENGARDYYWGHYVSNAEVAARDYENRVSEYQKDYGLSERDAYKYYSTQRPVDIGTFPKTESGPLYFVNFETREAVEMGRAQAWGYLVYDAPLTEKQIADYELKAAPGNPDVKTRLREQAQTVGAWEEKHGLPAINRYTERWLETESFIPTQFVTPEQMAKRYDYAKQELSRAADSPDREPISPHQLEAQLQAIGKYEDSKRMNLYKRLTWLHNDLGVYVKHENVPLARVAERYGEIMEIKARAAENLAARNKPIAERLAEAAEQAARDNATRPAPGGDKDKKDRGDR